MRYVNYSKYIFKDNVRVVPIYGNDIGWWVAFVLRCLVYHLLSYLLSHYLFHLFVATCCPFCLSPPVVSSVCRHLLFLLLVATGCPFCCHHLLSLLLSPPVVPSVVTTCCPFCCHHLLSLLLSPPVVSSVVTTCCLFCCHHLLSLLLSPPVVSSVVTTCCLFSTSCSNQHKFRYLVLIIWPNSTMQTDFVIRSSSAGIPDWYYASYLTTENVHE